MDRLEEIKAIISAQEFYPNHKYCCACHRHVPVLISEVESLRRELADRDATICGMREAWVKLNLDAVDDGDYISDHLNSIKIRMDIWKEADKIFSSTPTCPHKERAEGMKSAMSVYVDKQRNRYRRMIMCHMFADTLEELHTMADKIGVNRKWFQGKSTPHYDICLSMRKKAVENGAWEIGNRDAGVLIRRLRRLKSSLVGTAPVICQGCGGEINPDYGRCQRCG